MSRITIESEDERYKRLTGLGTCARCAYSDESLPGVLVCRYNPPVAYARDDPMGGFDALGLWPLVKKNEWCSKFELFSGDE